MQSTTRILIAFVLNLLFSAFELVGGLLTGSTAIASDALHAFGDSLSTGIAYLLELKSRQKDNLRYSILGAIITSTILMSGSLIIIHTSIERLFDPTEVNYDGMLVLALVGVVFSAVAALVTKDHPGHGHSHSHRHNFNQKTVSLHMLQDTLSWLVVLAGSLLIRFTDIRLLDPLLSISVALFILFSTLKNLNHILKSISVV